MPRSELIVALDCDQLPQALAWADVLDPSYCAVKVGSELFTRGGEPLVRRLVAQGFKVFLDLKFHDIPHTVARACAVAADLGVWMLDVHLAGGLAMLQAAHAALMPFGTERPLLVGVTVLTSMDNPMLKQVGIDKPTSAQSELLAGLAHTAGLDGVVCAAVDVPIMKAAYGTSFLTVTPGIRLAEDALQDQVRVVTPVEAQQLGSDYLVIGRSITQAADPASRVKLILNSLL